MGKASRDKGKRGQVAFRTLLGERDWTVVELQSGDDTEDLFAVSPDGINYAVEVKHTKTIYIDRFLAQAKEQAARRKTKWMLACRWQGERSWIVLCQGKALQIWHERQEVENV